MWSSFWVFFAGEFSFCGCGTLRNWQDKIDSEEANG
ncbi:unnamed protein product [Tenebrio molitor]|nr:unnamed protein product [Tenebrio molitor]